MSDDDDLGVPAKIYYRHYRIPDYVYAGLDSSKRHGKPEVMKHYRKGDKHNRFIPACRGGKTECYIVVDDQTYVGEAVCSLSDAFCYGHGRELAFQRALANWQNI